MGGVCTRVSCLFLVFSYLLDPFLFFDVSYSICSVLISSDYIFNFQPTVDKLEEGEVLNLISAYN